MAYLPDDRYHRELTAQTARIAEALEGVDPALTVPSCPKWTVMDLIEHVGVAERWSAMIIERRSMDLIRQSETDDADPPQDAVARSAWLRAGAERLSRAVQEYGAGNAIWTWSFDRTARFWLRRITHDMLIHRVDAEGVIGEHTPIAPDLAADSISDHLDTLSVLSGPKSKDPMFTALRGSGETLHLHATDFEGGEWLIRREPTGVVWEQGHAKGDLAVRGTARDLLLVIHRRVAPGDVPLELYGDEALLAHWIEQSRF
jgi:uncharacterized protein (TIGR03083 family)